MADDENAVVEVVIDEIVHGGEGLGRIKGGRVVFVPGAVPGDQVRATVVERQPDFLRAEIDEFVEPSEHRIEASCPYFDSCGGCQFWQVPYERELEWKVDAASEAVERAAGSELPDPEVHGAPQRRRYRSRAEFHRRWTGEETKIGFFEPRSDNLVAIPDCLIAEEPVNEARRELEPALEDVGDVDVMIETADADSCVVTVWAEEESGGPPGSLFEFAESLDESDAIRGIRYLGEDREWVGGDATVDGTEVLAYSPLDEIRVPAGLFRQANSEVNRQLVDRVAEMVASERSVRLLELYSGMGNFSFAVESHAAHVLGVEGDEAAVEMGNTIAEFAGLGHVHFVEADLADGFSDLRAIEEIGWNTVLLDPPRGGADAVCRELAAADARQIVYVSCDPPALGRDLRELADGGWQVEQLEMFDMFPATAHVEVVAKLRRG